ncbi:hypothetical protein HDU99_006323 [Rhizoclosmatium hyalinum]|nr:hypothetical protein HDU99_006323 [Rhizoclosmatium hyalinum]
MYTYHHWLGKAYILSILWATASSLLIHNKGLPTGVIFSFAWVMLGLTFGWLAITLHTKRVFKSKSPAYDGTNKWLLIYHQMLTLKAFHGCLMFVSWINVAGRLFVTKLEPDFGCYSYPVFKQVSSKDYTYIPGSPIEYLPVHDPNYSRVPWANKESAWAAQLSLGPLALAFVFGCVFVAFQRPQRSVNEPNGNVSDEQLISQ